MQKVETECKKLKKAQENKMACNSGESDDILTQSLKENAIYYIKVSGIPSGNKLIKTIRYLHM